MKEITLEQVKEFINHFDGYYFEEESNSIVWNVGIDADGNLVNARTSGDLEAEATYKCGYDCNSWAEFDEEFLEDDNKVDDLIQSIYYDLTH